MKNPKKLIIAAAMTGALALTGCSASNGAADSRSSDTNGSNLAIDIAGMDFEYTNRDKDASYDADTATRILLEGSSASIEGDGATAESHTVTIDDEGTYVVSGSLNGQLVVNAEDSDKVQIVLANASIANDDGPAVDIQSADKVFVTLADDSSNTLSDGASYALADGEDEPNAVVYSKADLTLNGSGSLNVAANYMHAINSKDDLVITGGTYTIESEEDALRGKDCVKILDGDFSIEAGGDGVKSSNDSEATRGFISIDGGRYTINAGDDGMQAATYLRLAGGEAQIEAGDDALESDIEAAMTAGSYTTDSQGKGVNAETKFTMDSGTLNINTQNEGIEAEKVIINDGTIDIVAADDGINAAAASTSSSSDAGDAPQDAAQQPQGSMQEPQGDMPEPPNGMARPEGDESMQGKQGRMFSPDGNNNVNGTEMQNRQGGMGGGEAVNEDCLIQINGGTIRITAGGDCLDSNGYLEVNGGQVHALAWGPGNEAVDSNATAQVADGTVIVEGNAQSGMQGMQGAMRNMR